LGSFEDVAFHCDVLPLLLLDYTVYCTIGISHLVLVWCLFRNLDSVPVSGLAVSKGPVIEPLRFSSCVTIASQSVTLAVSLMQYSQHS
jgi:hypothetical protein